MQPRKNRIVVDHGEIKDFMAEMVMSYRVVPITLLDGLETGDKIRFVIDAARQAIVKIEPLPDGRSAPPGPPRGGAGAAGGASGIGGGRGMMDFPGGLP